MAHLVSWQTLVLDKALGWLIFQAGLHVRDLDPTIIQKKKNVFLSSFLKVFNVFVESSRYGDESRGKNQREMRVPGGTTLKSLLKRPQTERNPKSRL